MVTFQQAQSDKDYEIIESLAREILPEAYSLIIPDDHIIYLLEKSHVAEAVKRQVSAKDCIYFLLIFNGITVGYLGIEFRQDSIILDKLYILKAYRANKIAKAALFHVDELASTSKLNKIELIVHKNNRTAIDVYSRSGFKIVDSLNHTFENGHSLEGYKMEKYLLNSGVQL